MPDKDMLDFLAGVKALYSFDYGTASLVGPDRVVIGVIDDTPPGVTVQQAASWIVEACRRASRTCETCGRSYYALGRLCCDAVNPDGEWVEPDHFCGYYEPKEAADAD